MLYEKILNMSKNYDCSAVTTIQSSHTLQKEIKKYLRDTGYNIGNLTNQGIIILFLLLHDVIYTVDKDNEVKYLSLAQDSLLELKTYNCIVPRADETYFEKTGKLITSRTQENINKYLKQGKFYCIELVRQRYISFLCTVKGFKDYPTLLDVKVYTLRELSSKYTRLNNELLGGYSTIKFTNNTVLVCTTSPMYNSRTINKGFLSNKFIANTLSDGVTNINILNVKSVEPFYQSSSMRLLANNVCKYKNIYVTLSRDALRQHYGDTYYLNESINVRKRMALELLIRTEEPLDPDKVIQKYNLGFEKGLFKNHFDLERGILATLKDKPTSSCVSVRQLVSQAQLNSNKRSYYVSIPIDELDKVEQYELNDYYIMGIKDNVFYSKLQKYNNINIAMTDAKKCFDKVLSVFSDREVKLTKTKQVNIAQNPTIVNELFTIIKSRDYKSSFTDFNLKLMSLFDTNYLRLTVTNESGKSAREISEDAVKYILINSLARKSRKPSELTAEDFLTSLLEFVDLHNLMGIEKRLTQELTSLATTSIKRLYLIVKKLIITGNLEQTLKSISSTFSYEIDKDIYVVKVETYDFMLYRDTTLGNKVLTSYAGYYLGKLKIDFENTEVVVQ